jgi:glycosyltransferase involved in cell wall biosynthesis|tara:strand:- start:16656 stop:18032 length:1377 start_codon:yes stop_codon:yes gene_type:complete
MKKLMLICAPVTSRSGYGAHARDLVWSFMDSDKYDIKIMDVRWGECPRNALDNDNINDKRILDCILPQPTLDRQPDIYVDIRIPNEFETHGKFNIGITAGIETNAVSQKWLEGCNKMDLVIVPSNHSKMGFVNTAYDKVQNTPDGKQQKVGELKLEKPMEVLFEGSDENIYKPLKHNEIPSDFFDMLNEKVSEKFAFLSVGQWTKGGYGEDRKDLARTIKIFYETFANKKKQPALILKTNGATYSILDREDVLKKIKDVKSKFPSDWKLPNVYLLHGNFTDEEMNHLYNHPKIKSLVSFTHGEGFGRPMLEATMVGLPVIASNWSGHIDFLDNEKSTLVGGEMQKIPESQVWKDILIEEGQWFVVDEAQSSNALTFSFDNQYEIKKKADGLMYNNRKKFTRKKMTELLGEMVDKCTQNLPTRVGLKLPKLKKVGDKKNDLPKIKLPKLKRVTAEGVTA